MRKNGLIFYLFFGLCFLTMSEIAWAPPESSTDTTAETSAAATDSGSTSATDGTTTEASSEATTEATTEGPGATNTPEIPTGSAPFLLVGALGVVLYLRKYFGKK